MATELPTATIIANARALQDSILPGQKHAIANPAITELSDASRAMIAAALYRDLNAAMVNAARIECAKTGEEFLYGGAPYTLQSGPWADVSRQAPTRYTEQSAWRDYSGWLCGSERMATWVAAWIARYLDPRDADGNPATGRVNKITCEGKPGMWLAVTGSYKVSD